MILVLSWVPLLVVGLLHPDSNPIGLGLLAWAGSLVGLVVAAIGLISGRSASRGAAAQRDIADRCSASALRHSAIQHSSDSACAFSPGAKRSI